MARNLEIKARIADLSAARLVVERLGARDAHTVDQVDQYYQLDGDTRVKLRTFGDGHAELIHYRRPEVGGVRTSDYEVTPVRDEATRTRLVPKSRPVVVVRKRREVHMLDNVRIHLDTVEILGTFLELEAVVDATHDEAECARQIDAIAAALGLGDADLIRASYADLVRRQA